MTFNSTTLIQNDILKNNTHSWMTFNRTTLIQNDILKNNTHSRMTFNRIKLIQNDILNNNTWQNDIQQNNSHSKWHSKEQYTQQNDIQQNKAYSKLHPKEQDTAEWHLTFNRTTLIQMTFYITQNMMTFNRTNEILLYWPKWHFQKHFPSFFRRTDGPRLHDGRRRRDFVAPEVRLRHHGPVRRRARRSDGTFFLIGQPSQGILNTKYHCTIDLLFDWFGLVCFANKSENCQLPYSWFQTSQTRGQRYCDTSPFSIHWPSFRPID